MVSAEAALKVLNGISRDPDHSGNEALQILHR